MITHLSGKLIEKNPTNLIIECAGIGYEVRISLNTYSAMGNEEAVHVFTQFVVREDAQVLYGFATRDEREMFNHLVSVSGIGPNTALIMLSSLIPEEIAAAIQSEDVRTIQGVKGIGAKTAQRVIVDLRDKMLKFNFSEENILQKNNTVRNDALNALLSLGFDKKAIEKVLDKLTTEDKTVEQIIKEALKML